MLDENHIATSYKFLCKQIQNIIPFKTWQLALIKGLRSIFFKQILVEQYISTEEAVAKNAASKQLVASQRQIAASNLLCATGQVPDALVEQASQTNELFTYTFDNAYCFRNFTLDSELNFISDATVKRLFETELYQSYKDIRAISPSYKINEEAIALNTGFTDNYYHWFADLIGRMLLMPDYQNKLICTNKNYPYQRETLELLGFTPEQIIYISDYSLYQFKKLHIISAPHAQSYDAFNKLQELAETITPNENAPQRLYISRGDVKKRRGINNEKELMPLLKKYGFTRMLFSNVPVKEQISLLRQAEYVIFPQGAAVINMLFCKPETRFLELYSPQFFDRTGVGISKTLGLTHHILIGEKPTREGFQADYSINPEHLEKSLKFLMHK